MSSIDLVIRFYAVSFSELKVGVALRFSNQSLWSIANEKGIDYLVTWLILTIGLPDLLTKVKNICPIS